MPIDLAELHLPMPLMPQVALSAFRSLLPYVCRPAYRHHYSLDNYHQTPVVSVITYVLYKF